MSRKVVKFISVKRTSKNNFNMINYYFFEGSQAIYVPFCKLFTVATFIYIYIYRYANTLTNFNKYV